MAYVHRIVRTGRTVEHKKMQSYRVHTHGVQRKANQGTTSVKQAKINERVAEEHLRWALNANFGYQDLHIVLHYYNKSLTFKQLLDDKERFLRELRRLCRKEGIRLKYVVVIETKRMTNPHIHVVISRMDAEMIAAIWEKVTDGNGAVTFKLLDRRGNHYKLAHYLMKESRSTMTRYKELGKRGQRYSKSQNMEKSEVKYIVVSAASWRKEPKAAKGAVLYKFDDGGICRSGWHEISGYPYQEYFEIFQE